MGHFLKNSTKGSIGEPLARYSVQQARIWKAMESYGKLINFFVRIPFGVFLDSMESSLSQEYCHVPVEGSG